MLFLLQKCNLLLSLKVCVSSFTNRAEAEIDAPGMRIPQNQGELEIFRSMLPTTREDALKRYNLVMICQSQREKCKDKDSVELNLYVTKKEDSLNIGRLLTTA